MIVIPLSPDVSFLDARVHALDLSVSPRILDFGETVMNAMFFADLPKDVFKGVPVSATIGKLKPLSVTTVSSLYGAVVITLRSNCAATI
jgi:hypothetical protein